MKTSVNFLFLSLFIQAAFAQSDLLKSGPMLGYSEMREAAIWLQTESPATVYALYGDSTTSEVFSTDTIKTTPGEANCGKLYFNHVLPGTTYSYRVYINGKRIQRDYPFCFTTQRNWQYHTNPPDFKMAMGSCVYVNEELYDRPGKPYGSHYEIFTSIVKQKPDAMLWLGDNTYLRPGDWTSRSGYLKRYTHTRALKELQPLLALANNFAIWDDHEFGPNNATGSWHLKDVALETFRLFWLNPSYGYRDLPGIMSKFTYGDMDFFLMDNRYYRTENYQQGPKQIFGREQCDKLIDQLKASTAPFKFIVTGGQFLNTAKVYENHANYPQERTYLLTRIDQEEIKGVVFISGDRHHSEVMRYETPKGIVLHELTVSPLTSGVGKVDETNENLVKGSVIEEQNFAVMECTGTFGNRKAIIHFYNSSGEPLYNYTIEAPKGDK